MYVDGLMERKPTENVTDIENCFKTILMVKESKTGILQREIWNQSESLAA